MSFNPVSSIEEIIPPCPVEFEPMIGEHRPMSLYPCMHTVGNVALNKLKMKPKKDFNCPICRAAIQGSGINYALESLIESLIALQEKAKKSVQKEIESKAILKGPIVNNSSKECVETTIQTTPVKLKEEPHSTFQINLTGLVFDIAYHIYSCLENGERTAEKDNIVLSYPSGTFLIRDHFSNPHRREMNVRLYTIVFNKNNFVERETVQHDANTGQFHLVNYSYNFVNNSYISHVTKKKSFSTLLELIKFIIPNGMALSKYNLK